MNGTVICNPMAGRRMGDRSLDPALNILKLAGWDLSVYYTGGPGEATALARQAVDAQHDAVLVAGGDGTINETVQALAHSNTALGLLPYGTVNVWAREMGIPLDPRGAAHALAGGRIERVDLGCASNRYFLLSAGVGFDGEVVRRAELLERHKHRLGILSYIMTGLSTVLLYRGADVELRYDGVIRRVEALMLVVGNSRLYGGYFEITPNAVVNDGWLDLCILKGHGLLALARQILSVLIFRSVAHSDVELLRVREVTVTAKEQLWMQVDGELAGPTPIQFSIAPKALRVIIPESLTSGLIAS